MFFCALKWQKMALEDLNMPSYDAQRARLKPNFEEIRL